MHAPAKPMSPMQSSNDSSSSCLITSKRTDLYKQKPTGVQYQLEATAFSSSSKRRTSIFKQFGAVHVKGDVHFSSKQRAPGNSESSSTTSIHCIEITYSSKRSKQHAFLLKRSKAYSGSSRGTLSTRSPFVAEIQKEVLSLNVQQPYLETYEGLIDPDDHLANFLSALQLHNFSNATLCMLFFSTLK